MIKASNYTQGFDFLSKICKKVALKAFLKSLLVPT